MRSGQTQRVLRPQTQIIRHQRQRSISAQLEPDLGIIVLPVGVAMVAIAVGFQNAGIEHEINVVLLTAQLQAVFALSERTSRKIWRGLGARLAALGKHADHATSRVAIERRKRAAHYLDTISGDKVNVRHLTLPVGHRAGNAVDKQLDVARPKGRIGTEAARGDQHILGVILTVQGKDAGDTRQRFRQILFSLPVMDILRIQNIDRCRGIQYALFAATGRGNHLGQERRLVVSRLRLCVARRW